MNYIRMAADQIEARATAKVTAEGTAKFQGILQEEKEKLQQKDSENAILRAALEANGIDV